MKPSQINLLSSPFRMMVQDLKSKQKIEGVIILLLQFCWHRINGQRNSHGSACPLTFSVLPEWLSLIENLKGLFLNDLTRSEYLETMMHLEKFEGRGEQWQWRQQRQKSNPTNNRAAQNLKPFVLRPYSPGFSDQPGHRKHCQAWIFAINLEKLEIKVEQVRWIIKTLLVCEYTIAISICKRY